MSKLDKRSVHVVEIKKTSKGKVHVSTYLRSAFRQDGKVRQKTVANISDLLDDLLSVIKNRLATGLPLVVNGDTMIIERRRPHGNVAAVMGNRRNIGLNPFIAARAYPEWSLVMTMTALPLSHHGSLWWRKSSVRNPRTRRTRRTPENLPVQTFQDLLQDMATLTLNSIRFESNASMFHQQTESTTLQRHALELLSTHA